MLSSSIRQWESLRRLAGLRNPVALWEKAPFVLLFNLFGRFTRESLWMEEKWKRERRGNEGKEGARVTLYRA